MKKICVIIAFGISFLYVNFAKAQKEVKLPEVNETFEMRFQGSFSEGLKYKMLGNKEEATRHFKKCTEISPNRPAPYYELGAIFLSKNSPLEAENYAFTADSLGNNNKWYKLLLIETYLVQKRFKDAANAYEQLYGLNEESIEFLLAEIDLRLKSKEYDKALIKLKLLEKHEDYYAEAKLREKNVWLAKGKSKKAIKLMENLANEFEDIVEYRGILAEMLVEQGDDKEALKQFERIKQSNPDNPIVYFSLGQYYLNIGKNKEAIDEFTTGFSSKQVSADIKVSVFGELMKYGNSTTLEPELVNLLNVLYEADKGHKAVDALYGNYLYDSNRNEEAEVVYKGLVDRDPSNFMIWQNLLLIQNDQLDFEDMYLISKRAIASFPSQTIFYLFNGISSLSLKKYDEAVVILKKGARLNVSNGELTKQYYSSLGDALYHNGEHKEAFKNFDLLLVLDSKNTIVLNNYAYYLSELNQELEKARSMIDRCLVLEPNNSTYLDTKAWVLFKAGQYKEALQFIEKVIQNEEDNSGEILEHYGDILFKNGHEEEALEAWISAAGKGDTSDILGRKIKDKKWYE